MKKLILGFAAIAACLSSFAQTDSSRNQTDHDRSTNQRQNNQQQNNTPNQNQDENTRYQQTKDCMLVMEGGEVKQIKEGKAMAMGKKITLDNGTEVTADGIVRMKDGKTVRMKEGECVDKSGKIAPVRTLK